MSVKNLYSIVADIFIVYLFLFIFYVSLHGGRISKEFIKQSCSVFGSLEVLP